MAIITALSFVFKAALHQVSEDADASNCRSNLAYLKNAIDLYWDTYGVFPPAYITDEAGTPLYSWRVLILPNVEKYSVYKLFEFTEPWDSAHNKKLADMVYEPGGKVFHCPGDHESPLVHTNYLALIGPNTAWPGTGPLVVAPSPNSLLLVETYKSGINWMEPRDVSVENLSRACRENGSLPISSPHRHGIHYIPVGRTLGTIVSEDRERLTSLLSIQGPAPTRPDAPQSIAALVKHLIGCLQYEGDHHRHSAVLLLGQFGSDARAATAPLNRLLTDPDRNVRKAAEMSLRKINRKLRKG